MDYKQTDFSHLVPMASLALFGIEVLKVTTNFASARMEV